MLFCDNRFTKRLNCLKSGFQSASFLMLVIEEFGRSGRGFNFYYNTMSEFGYYYYNDIGVSTDCWTFLSTIFSIVKICFTALLLTQKGSKIDCNEAALFSWSRESFTRVGVSGLIVLKMSISSLVWLRGSGNLNNTSFVVNCLMGPLSLCRFKLPSAYLRCWDSFLMLSVKVENSGIS
jgi:hypothetical protein